MRTQKVKLEKLIPNERNVRVHGEKQINEFKKSIEQFGIIRPIVCDENYVILCGHGLYRALIQMGRTEADILILTGLSETQKKKLLLADNKIYTLGSDDYDAIDKLLYELNGDFDIPGFSAEDLELLYGSSSLEEDIKKYEIPLVGAKNVKVPENKVEIKEESFIPAEQGAEAIEQKYIICPYCNHRIEIG